MTAGRLLTIVSLVAALLCPALSLAQTPTPTPTPCTAALEIADLEDMEIDTLRGGVDEFYYQAFVAGNLSDRFGYVYDSNQIFVDEDSFAASPVAIWVGADAGPRAVQAGDFVRLTYDSGSTLDVYFPAVTGYDDDTFYVGADGSTYTDIGLCAIAYAAPTPTPTATPYAPWPMFRHNARHTGRSGYSGPRSCVLAWSYETGHVVRSSPAIGVDGIVYAGSVDRRIYGILPDGSLLWSYTTGNGVDSSPAIGADGSVYMGSKDNIIYALDSAGSLTWSYETGDIVVSSSPALGADGSVYIGSWDNRIYALDPAGSLAWSYQTGNWVYYNYVESSPAIGTDGTIYVGSYDFRIYGILSDGSLLWSYGTGSGAQVKSSPAIGADGTVFAGSNTGRIYGILPDGSLLWSYTAARLESSPAIGTDGTVYIGAGDNRFYAFNFAGSLAWSYQTGKWHYNESVNSSPAIGADGTLYVGSRDNRVYGILSDGSLLWSYMTENYVDSSPAIGADGRIYIGSSDNNIYALDEPTPTPTWNPAVPTYTPTPLPVPSPGTFYLRSDLWRMNGYLGRALRNQNSTYSDIVSNTCYQCYPGNAAWASDVFVVNSDGSETQIGSYVAHIYRNYETGWWEVPVPVSETWDCPATALARTDAIKITEKVIAYNQTATESFITAPLGADQLESSVWTFTRWVSAENPWNLYVKLYYGDNSYDSRVSNIAFSTFTPTATPTPTPTWDPTVPTYTPTPTPTITPTYTPGAQVNFQPAAATPAPSFLSDWGQDYGDQGEREYGWQ